MNAILSGQCDVGLVNTYYYGRLIEKKPNIPLKLFWANQDTNGKTVPPQKLALPLTRQEH
jgi:iron(III) transport system substrate-binding protein